MDRPLKDLPPIPVAVEPVLPPGQIEPHPLSLAPSPCLGGYRLLRAARGLAWLAGLAAILLAGRRKRVEAEARHDPARDPGRPSQAAGRRGHGRQAEPRASTPSSSGC